jgi:hypothetical protein
MDAHVTWLPESADKRRAPRESVRWATFGPYYAMFPVPFARQVIQETTSPGDSVLDPFAGRGTSIFCAGEVGRGALGSELNPVGWLYARTKLRPARLKLVLARLVEVALHADGHSVGASQMPTFYHYCFAPNVLRFLLAARDLLKWQTRGVDATLMAFILTYLHGKIERGRPSALSNQMRQTKAMAPDYSVKWWKEHGFLTPPELCPVEFLTQRIQWRYKFGVPHLENCAVRFGDCREVLRRQRSHARGRFRLLLTSPPYCGVTSYYYDQWLRLWMLGEAAHPTRAGASWKGKFEDPVAYESLLTSTFSTARRLLASDATIYVRTDARELTLSITKAVLLKQFPDKTAEFVAAPYAKATQTSLFGDKLSKPGEYDIILRPGKGSTC